MSFRDGGALTSSSCPHYDLQLSPHVLPVVDRRHGSDAWPQPCAGSVRLNRAPDPCQTPAPLWLTRPLYIHTDLATRAAIFCYPSEPLWRAHTYDYNPSAGLYPSWWFAREEKGRVRLHNRRPTRPDSSLINACSQSAAGSIGGKAPFCQTLLHLKHGKVSLSPSDCQRMNEFKPLTSQS